MTVQSITDTDLSAWLEESIPCGNCPRPAKLRSFGHQPKDCGNTSRGRKPPYYLCLECYGVWHREIVAGLAKYKAINCRYCQQQFPDERSFSDYREF